MRRLAGHCQQVRTGRSMSVKLCLNNNASRKREFVCGLPGIPNLVHFVEVSLNIFEVHLSTKNVVFGGTSFTELIINLGQHVCGLGSDVRLVSVGEGVEEVRRVDGREVDCVVVNYGCGNTMNLGKSRSLVVKGVSDKFLHHDL